MKYSALIIKLAICVGILGLISGITFMLLTKNQEKISQSDTPSTAPTAFLQQQSEQNSGNNNVAKTYAQQIHLSAQNFQSGLVTKVYVQLTPNMDPKQSESTYKNTVISAKELVQVDKNTWDSLTENQMQNLLNEFTTILHLSASTSAGITIIDQNGNSLVTGHQ